MKQSEFSWWYSIIQDAEKEANKLRALLRRKERQ